MFRYLLPLCMLSAGSARAQEPAVLALERTVQDAIAAAEPSIACIAVSRSARFRDFDGEPEPQPPGRLGRFHSKHHDLNPRAEVARQIDLALPDHVPESYGSGIVIDEAGLILTNYHVVQNATKVYVRLPGKAGSYADIHAADVRADLAVLRMIDVPRGLEPLAMGAGEKLRKGSWVISLANPFSVGFRDGSPSAAWGIVSNLRRRAPGPTAEDQRTRPLRAYGSLIQTDARLNLGCSGGALIDLTGKMVGLTTSLAAVVGGESAGGYAVPFDSGMRSIVETLRKGREVEYGFLGVQAVPTEDPRFRPGTGVAVSSVTRGSPAFLAGLRNGDSILRVNEHDIVEYDDLFLRIGSALAGSEVKLTIRGPRGEQRTATATLAKFPHPLAWIASDRGPTVQGLRVEYSSIAFNGVGPIGELPTGVLVRDIEPDSPAAGKFKGLFDGNARLLITAVDGRPVRTPAEFYRAAGAGRGVELTLVDLNRADQPARTITLPE